jgi:hypothetical protein
MGKRAKSLFCLVLFNEFHHRTKLMALLFSDFVFIRYLSARNYKTLSLKVPPIQIPTQNEKMKILLSEFHPRTNLTTQQNTQNFEIKVPKGTPLVKVFEILSRNGFHGLKMVLSCSEGTI